ncbi:ankyrin repeat domain-containing protein [Massilia sp. DJPM01]|uniref:ankyrin repeat domain-containing protein n=1 Tax=Massilia sp. DJPM01 TaxID=3024404 RepID=UPI00259F1515|nr:ankyrin repeat domain-containing protein [Massilia sp. DJPM01]MDM5182269.1 ankyrin repeat domain-containing protein [Massilia sp. DJPM01]
MSINMKLIEEVYRRCAKTGAWYGVEISRFDQRNFMEDTVLHTVCSWGDLAAVKILVTAGADVNAKGDQGATPLFNAVIGGNPEVILFLLKSGADPQIVNGYKRQVLEYAKNISASSTIVELLEKATKGKKARG